MTKQTAFFKSCLGVFQGGGCRAAAYVGAVQAAVARGVSFTEVSGTSAGSIVAALLGAGAKPSQLAELLQTLDFAKLLAPPRAKGGSMAKTAVRLYSKELSAMIFDEGIFSSEKIESWIEDCLKKIIKTNSPKLLFRDLLLPTYIVSTDLSRRETKIWSQDHTPNDSVAKAVRASCSIPLFFQPVDDWLVDGGVLSNLPSFVFAHRDRQRPLTSRILAFSLTGEPAPTSENRSPFDYLMSIADTVADGAGKLQGDLQPEVHKIEIDSAGVKPTDFDKMNGDLTTKLISNGAAAANKFFDEELVHIRPRRSLDTICSDRDELYARAALSLGERLSRVVIAENDTDWVFSLFPTLMAWRSRNTDVVAILPQHGDSSKHGPYRRRLLESMGAQVHVIDGVSALDTRAWVFVTEDSSRRSALVGLPQAGHGRIQAVQYHGELDATAIQAVLDKITRQIHLQPFNAASPPRLIRGSGTEQLGLRLSRVGQYTSSSVRLEFRHVPISKLQSLAAFVREYKYIQIAHWVEFYKTSGIELFSPADVRLTNGGISIATPPVVEKYGENYVLIEGTTRATYLRDAGADELMCIVAEGVTHPLPGTPISLEKVRVVGRELGPTERYEKFDYSEFRHIESNVHLIEDLGT